MVLSVQLSFALTMQLQIVKVANLVVGAVTMQLQNVLTVANLVGVATMHLQNVLTVANLVGVAATMQLQDVLTVANLVGAVAKLVGAFAKLVGAVATVAAALVVGMVMVLAVATMERRRLAMSVSVLSQLSQISPLYILWKLSFNYDCRGTSNCEERLFTSKDGHNYMLSQLITFRDFFL